MIVQRRKKSAIFCAHMVDFCRPGHKSRINGVASKMKKFDFLFGLMLAERILKHTDNLSKTIQAIAMPAVEARGLSNFVYSSV